MKHYLSIFLFTFSCIFLSLKTILHCDYILNIENKTHIKKISIIIENNKWLEKHPLQNIATLEKVVFVRKNENNFILP